MKDWPGRRRDWLSVQHIQEGRAAELLESFGTTDGHGRVADLTLAQIKALRLRAGAGGPDAPPTDAAPPTFAEAMLAARGGVLVNVDAKGEVNLQAVQELERLGLVDHALFKSAAPPEDRALRQVLDGRDLLFMPILREVDGTSLVTTPDRYGSILWSRATPPAMWTPTP
ncbi:hypothetical protein [Brevundimonas sp. TSRC1-1]|uniref:hypothetical protein n=1 Tax=Brevundimonas sp. TSRC1-1 TaxID=2804562 RepID=UPI003CF205F8